MNFSQDGKARSTKRFIGIGIVVLLHGVLIYALVTGLDKPITKPVEPPVEMQIIQPVKPPPPPKPIIQPKEEPKPVKEKVVPKPDPKPTPKPVPPKPAPFVPKPQVAPPVQADAPKVTTQSEEKAPPSPPVKEVTATPAPPAPEKPKGETKGVSGSASASCPTPQYPQEALANEEQGTVKLELDVGADGHVANAKVAKSSGSRNLDKATVSAYKKCVFAPAMKDGAAVAGSISLEYTFKLD
ncbi:energy transducer TonB [Acinetobacter rathckeae]|uniref:energy transducer TonB n=1 Tax=Acinetobacter rathckeae TaxID=2605272 RepID=UPI0018A2AD01|nr:energy transducer TonB [Acinetobacter rathckeae]MBF7687226.1 energy transducer TonB [Acinetobacter rathckeae]